MVKVTFGNPQAGWVPLSIIFPNAGFDCVASYVPNDAIEELAEQMPKLLRISDRFSVWLNTEPDVYNLVGDNAGDAGKVTFRIILYKQGRRTEANAKTILEETCQGEELFIAFRRGLRSLQGRMDSIEFSKKWGRPFPQKAIERVTDLREALRREK